MNPQTELKNPNGNESRSGRCEPIITQTELEKQKIPFDNRKVPDATLTEVTKAVMKHFSVRYSEAARILEVAIEPLTAKADREARIDELGKLPLKVFDCSPLMYWGYTFDEREYRIKALQKEK